MTPKPPTRERYDAAVSLVSNQLEEIIRAYVAHLEAEVEVWRQKYNLIAYDIEGDQR